MYGHTSESATARQIGVEEQRMSKGIELRAAYFREAGQMANRAPSGYRSSSGGFVVVLALRALLAVEDRAIAVDPGP